MVVVYMKATLKDGDSYAWQDMVPYLSDADRACIEIACRCKNVLTVTARLPSQEEVEAN